MILPGTGGHGVLGFKLALFASELLARLMCTTMWFVFSSNFVHVYVALVWTRSG